MRIRRTSPVGVVEFFKKGIGSGIALVARMFEGTRVREFKRSKIVALVEEQFELLDLAGPLQVITAANRLRDFYDPVTVSVSGGPVMAAAGTSVSTLPLHSIDGERHDTVLVLAGKHDDAVQRQVVIDWLASIGCHARRVCGIGAHATRLIEVALFSRRDSVADPEHAGAAGPDIDAQPIASRRGRVWSCVGASAAIDFSLALVADDLGYPMALMVARSLVMFVVRRLDDPQVSRTLMMQIKGGSSFAELLHRIRDRLSEDLRVETLASWCNMTPRTFARRFAAELGETPAAAIRGMRVEMAKFLIRDGGLAIKNVARVCGFRTEASLRRALAATSRRR